MKSKNTGLIATILILSILLVASIVMGLTGFFCSFSVQEFVTDLQAGQNLNINVFANETSIQSFTLDGTILPGGKIPFVVQISAPETENDVVFRVKSIMFGDPNEEKIMFDVDENFSIEGDYYYYNNTLQGGDKVTFCHNIFLPRTDAFGGEKRYVLTICVETLDAEFDSNVIWKNNL